MDSGSRNTCIIFNPSVRSGGHCCYVLSAYTQVWNLSKLENSEGQMRFPHVYHCKLGAGYHKGDEKGIHPRHLTFEGSGKLR